MSEGPPQTSSFFTSRSVQQRCPICEGMAVGPRIGDDVFPTGEVVRRKDGSLWVVAEGEHG